MQIVSISISTFKLIDMKMKIIFSLLVMPVIFFSCNHSENDKSKNIALLSALEVTQENQQPGKNSQEPLQDTTQQGTISANPANAGWDKKIIKTASLKLEVKDIKRCNESVHQAISQFGAYIASEEQQLVDEMTETTMTLKVPVMHFEAMMNQLSGFDAKIIERKISTDDVTAQVIDTRSRLEAKKQMRLKYLEFLKQSKNMAEVLQVQQEIDGIQEEIEAATGRVNYLSQQAQYSTINLVYYQPVAGFSPVNKDPGFFSRVSEAFKLGVNWIADIFVALISIWPLVLLISLAWVGWRRFRMVTPIAHH